jgi:hypothetical protein
LEYYFTKQNGMTSGNKKQKKKAGKKTAKKGAKKGPKKGHVGRTERPYKEGIYPYSAPALQLQAAHVAAAPCETR